MLHISAESGHLKGIETPTRQYCPNSSNNKHFPVARNTKDPNTTYKCVLCSFEYKK